MPTAQIQQFDDLIGQVYAAPLEPGRWPQVLEQLSDFLEGAATKLTFQDTRTLHSEAMSVRMPPEADRSYAQYYYKTNVFLPRVARLPAGTMIPISRLLPRDVYLRSEYHNDFCRPGDMCHSIGVVLANEPDVRVVFTCGRAEASGEFDSEPLDRLGRIGPHLVRAAAISLRLSNSEIAGSAGAEALDSIGQGVLLVAEDGAILFANRAAERLLAEADGITSERSRLRAALPGDAGRLRRLIAAAVLRAEAAGGAMVLGRPPPRRPLHVLAAPVTTGLAWFAPRRPLALVYVSDPDGPAQIGPDQLRALFRLTPAEAAVAMAIARGRGLQAAADELGIGLTTARTHLQHVFDKTETRRQAELVRLIASAGAGFQR